MACRVPGRRGSPPLQDTAPSTARTGPSVQRGRAGGGVLAADWGPGPGADRQLVRWGEACNHDPAPVWTVTPQDPAPVWTVTPQDPVPVWTVTPGCVPPWPCSPPPSWAGPRQWRHRGSEPLSRCPPSYPSPSPAAPGAPLGGYCRSGHMPTALGSHTSPAPAAPGRPCPAERVGPAWTWTLGGRLRGCPGETPTPVLCPLSHP